MSRCPQFTYGEAESLEQPVEVNGPTSVQRCVEECSKRKDDNDDINGVAYRKLGDSSYLDFPYTLSVKKGKKKSAKID